MLVCVCVAFAIREGLTFYIQTFMVYHLSSKATVSDLSPLTSIKGRSFSKYCTFVYKNMPTVRVCMRMPF